MHIRRPGPDEAEAWVGTYLDALVATYAGLLPARFGTEQRTHADALVARYREVFAAQRAAPDGPHRAWFATDAVGPVGVAEVRTGPAGWEVERGYPPAATTRQLTKLYTLPRAHGSGLGQALLDTALAAGPAYLWIIAGNGRAEAFYRRNRFVPDGLADSAGPTWFEAAMFRMHRINRATTGA